MANNGPNNLALVQGVAVAQQTAQHQQGVLGPTSLPLGSAGASSRKASDQRFRSFAERYLVARAAFFRQDPNGLAEDTWSCILDAKRAYALIERTGQNIQPEDMTF